MSEIRFNLIHKPFNLAECLSSHFVGLIISSLGLIILLLLAKNILNAERNACMLSITILQKKFSVLSAQCERFQAEKRNYEILQEKIFFEKGLEEERLKMRRLLVELSRIAPFNAYFTKVKAEKNKITIKIILTRKQDLMALLSRVRKLSFFKEPQILTMAMLANGYTAITIQLNLKT